MLCFSGEASVWACSYVPGALENTRQMIVTSIAAALARDEFRIESQSEMTIVLTRMYREFLTWLVTIFLFPLGLVALFAYKKTDNLTVLMSQVSGSATKLVISGVASRRTATGIKGAFSD